MDLDLLSKIGGMCLIVCSISIWIAMYMSLVETINNSKIFEHRPSVLFLIVLYSLAPIIFSLIVVYGLTKKLFNFAISF